LTRQRWSYRRVDPSVTLSSPILSLLILCQRTTMPACDMVKLRKTPIA
jgi:hypothetical protein